MIDAVIDDATEEQPRRRLAVMWRAMTPEDEATFAMVKARLPWARSNADVMSWLLAQERLRIENRATKTDMLKLICAVQIAMAERLEELTGKEFARLPELRDGLRRAEEIA